MKLKSICGVIIASRDPEALAEFYSHVFSVPFERETHGDLDVHYGVDIGKVHLGIHPPQNLGRSEVGRSSILIAYNVDSLEQVMARLSEVSSLQVLPPHDQGFGMVATYQDPDGNPFEIVELSYEFCKE